MAHQMQCCVCNTDMWLPDELYQSALKCRGPKGVSFYCAYGHSQHFSRGESNEEKLRRERDFLAQRIARRDEQIKRERERVKAAERRAAAARGQLTKMRNRVGPLTKG